MTPPQYASPPPYPHSLSHPPQSDRAPAVLLWYRIYCGLMTLAFLPFPLAIAVMVLFPQWAADAEHSPQEIRFIGAVMFLPFTLLLLAYAITFFLPRRPWVWIYHMVIICLGMTSCLLPGCIAMLIYWLKPETKAYFQRG